MSRKVSLAIVVVTLLFLTLGIPPLQQTTEDWNPTTLIGKGIKTIFTIGLTNQVYGAETPDYTCDGTNDDVQFQAALDALPSGGGKIIIYTGNYNFGATVTRAINNVCFEGSGVASYLAYNGATALISAGSQDNWVFRDLKTDAGGITRSSATHWVLQNVWIGSTYYGLTTSTDLQIGTGRAATVTVATSDATNVERRQADYICDGTDDQVQVNAALQDIKTAGGGTLLILGKTINIDTLTLISGNDYYGVKIPVSGTVGKSLEIQIKGMSRVSLSGNAYVQTEGCRFLVTSAALTAIGDTKHCHAIWQESGTTQYPSLILENIDVAFPSNQRTPGLEYAFSLYNTATVYIKNCQARFTTTYDSMSVPLETSYGFRTCPTPFDQVTLVHCVAAGYYIGFAINSELTYLNQCMAWRCKYPFWFGIEGAIGINHPIVLDSCTDGQCKYGLQLGAYMNNGSMLILHGYSVEFYTSGTWSRTADASENHAGYTWGYIDYQSTEAGVGLGPRKFWESGSGTKIETERASGTATITAGQTSVSVSHGLRNTPTRVQLTPTTDTGGKRYWVSAKGSSTFTITVDSSYGSNIIFDWRATVGDATH